MCKLLVNKEPTLITQICIVKITARVPILNPTDVNDNRGKIIKRRYGKF